MRNLVLIFLVILLFGCNSDESEPSSNSESASFNTFGVKWGDDPTFSPTGFDVGGPRTSGETVTFSFRTTGVLLETHSQSGIESLSFSEIVPFAKEEIRNALNSWSEKCQIDFVEQSENMVSDINFFIAPIEQGGVGYPPLTTGINGSDITGHVIFQPNQNHSQHGFYVFALHEIGHVLGLGHVETDNIMKQGTSIVQFSGLQNGDIAGIQSIYGEK